LRAKYNINPTTRKKKGKKKKKNKENQEASLRVNRVGNPSQFVNKMLFFV
jgi:hypothetical protein